MDDWDDGFGDPFDSELPDFGDFSADAETPAVEEFAADPYEAVADLVAADEVEESVAQEAADEQVRHEIVRSFLNDGTREETTWETTEWTRDDEPGKF